MIHSAIKEYIQYIVIQHRPIKNTSDKPEEALTHAGEIMELNIKTIIIFGVPFVNMDGII